MENLYQNQKNQNLEKEEVLKIIETYSEEAEKKVKRKLGETFNNFETSLENMENEILEFSNILSKKFEKLTAPELEIFELQKSLTIYTNITKELENNKNKIIEVQRNYENNNDNYIAIIKVNKILHLQLKEIQTEVKELKEQNVKILEQNEEILEKLNNRNTTTTTNKNNGRKTILEFIKSIF